MQGKQLRAMLRSGQRVYGTHVCGLSNAVANNMLAVGPLDFVFLCTEHMPLDRAETSLLCQMYAGRGVSPIVRIPYPSAHHATMALDGGAQGIVAPYVETVQQVKEIVGAVHYRPIKGRLLQEFLNGARFPTQKTLDFLARFNQNSHVIIGIESVAAHENLDELIHEPGVDGVFIGPHDLSVSLEAPEEWDNPEFLSMIEDIVIRCRRAGVGVGVHLNPLVFSLEQAKHLVDLGMNWILDSADVVQAKGALTERRTTLCGTPFASPAADVAADVASCLMPQMPSGKRNAANKVTVS